MSCAGVILLHPSAAAGAHPGERARRRCLLVYRYGAKVCPDMQTVRLSSSPHMLVWVSATLVTARAWPGTAAQATSTQACDPSTQQC